MAERITRSSATHAITFEWVKCCRPPRTSQMPSSGWVQRSSTEPASAVSSAHAPSVSAISDNRAWCSASSTSPNTSSWNCSWAPLPIRTGREPS